tara:strand:+ start:236 stop:613 length:378 start_codon:yes stop_codon:yes gene_type:complete
MKIIKLILIILLTSTFSYSQTDTIVKMINDKNIHTYNLDNEIVHSSDPYQKGLFKDFTIELETNQILLLHLYDNCKKCTKTIEYRNVVFHTRKGEIENKIFESKSSVYFINGKLVDKIIIKKPNE